MRRGSCRSKIYEAPPPPAERDARHTVNLAALMSDGLRGGPVQVVDLSMQGFSGRTLTPAAIGAEVNVILPGVGAMKAQVRWALCGVFGARFDAPLTPRQLAACLAGG